MLPWIARISCFLALMISARFVPAQADFSAEMWEQTKLGIPNMFTTPVVYKLYLTKDKMRAEGQSGNTREGGSIIINFATRTSITLLAHRQMYIETPAQSQIQRLGYPFFQASDAGAACADWLQLAGNQGGSCRKVAEQSVHGREAIKYEATNSSGDVSRFWIDPKLGFPVRWESKSSDGELRNIKEGTQPASLFEIPAGFNKMQR